MRKPVVVVDDPILERCLGKDGQVVNYFEPVTQPRIACACQKEEGFDSGYTINYDQKTSS